MRTDVNEETAAKMEQHDGHGVIRRGLEFCFATGIRHRERVES